MSGTRKNRRGQNTATANINRKADNWSTFIKSRNIDRGVDNLFTSINIADADRRANSSSIDIDNRYKQKSK